MACQYKGLPKFIAGFTDQYLIEDIQELAWEFSGKSSKAIPYSEWLSSRYFEETKEHFGM